MSGGEIVVKPPANRKYVAHENSIVGNTCLYGATGGWFYASGRAGERFAVRNSGATAVVEGVGDHGCEYMTGGVALVLGRTGKNFGAGMTGGVAFVLDLEACFPIALNPELVKAQPLEVDEDVLTVKELIYKHLERTESERARAILADWNSYQSKFWKVEPIQTVPKPSAAAVPTPAGTPATKH